MAALAQAGLMLAFAQARLREAEAAEARADGRRALGEAEAARDAALARAAAAEATVAAIEGSTSWRLVRVLQRAAALVRRRVPVVGAVPGAGPGAPVSGPALDGNGNAHPGQALPDDAVIFEAAYDAFMASGAMLEFPAPAAPDVSVIVAPREPAVLLACLQALLAQAGCRFEVLAAGMPAALAGRCANLAGAAAGRAVLHLDGGALLRPGALAAAWGGLAEGVGAVAGRLALASGLVHSAGGVLWSDGTSAAYGAGLADGCGEVMFRRDVDHGSRHLMLLGRDAPGPLTDDAAQGAPLRAVGLRVTYEPRFAADLFGAAEEPAPCRAGQRRLRTPLPASCRLPPHPANLVFARDTAARPRLLFIDSFVPLAVMGAGYPRARAMLNEADALGWGVTLYPLDAGDAGWEAIHGSLARSIEVCNRRGAAELGAFLAERAGYYDTVLVSRPENMAVVRGVLRDAASPLLGSARVVYDAEALFSLRAVQRRALDGDPASAAEHAAMVAEEMALTEGVDAVVAVTPAEAAVFAGGQTAPVTVLSHPVEPRQDAPGFAGRAGFLFVGRLLEKASPNYDGLAWFIRAVWPGIRAALPDAELVVAGAACAGPDELAAAGVRLLGPVAELRPVYDAARVFVAPVRYAAGVPIKALEAAEAGLPVLTTTLAAGQLSWQAGKEVAAADDAGVLADQGVALHGDAGLWARIRAGAAARLRDEHSRAGFRAALHAVLTG